MFKLKNTTKNKTKKQKKTKKNKRCQNWILSDITFWIRACTNNIINSHHFYLVEYVNVLDHTTTCALKLCTGLNLHNDEIFDGSKGIIYDSSCMASLPFRIGCEYILERNLTNLENDTRFTNSQLSFLITGDIRKTQRQG